MLAMPKSDSSLHHHEAAGLTEKLERAVNHVCMWDRAIKPFLLVPRGQ